jgi:hypothetical protein
MTTPLFCITGWILTALVGLFLIAASAIPKFLSWEGKDEMMAQLGIPLTLLPTIAVIEIAVALLYVIPRTAVFGAILLTGHLGGAIFTHLRVGDPWFFPLIIGGVAWAGLCLRRPEVFALITGHRTTSQEGI